jgi:DNA-binding MarR family transcriptional regulator
LSANEPSFSLRSVKGLIGGRTASDMPGLDIAEQKSWQNYLTAARRIYAELNVRMLEKHELSLGDVRLLHILSNSVSGIARMRDLADAMPAPSSRLTRQVRRLEGRGLVRRATSPDDRRGVIATITDKGRAMAEEATASYAREVRKNFIDRLSRPQIVAMESSCRKINTALKQPGPLADS